MGGLSIWHWLIVLLVVVLIFGTKKLRNIGSDVGGAVKSFKDAMNDEKAVAEATILNTVKEATPPLIEGKVVEAPAAAAPKKRAPAKKAATTAKPAAAKAKATTAKPKTEAAKKPAAKKPAAKKAPAKPNATETA